MAEIRLIPAFKGSLDRVHLARCMHRLAVAGETGILRVESGNVSVSLRFHGGALIDMGSILPEFTLAGHLFSAGRIDARRLEELSGSSRLCDDRQYSTMLEKQLVQSHEIVPLQQEFMLNSLSKLLQMTTGQYIFFRFDPAPEQCHAPIRFQVPSTIAESIRRAAASGKLDNHLLPSVEALVGPFQGPLLSIDALKPNSRELRLFRLCETGGTVGEILERLKPANDAERLGALSFIYTLLQLELAGITVPVSPAGISAAGPVTTAPAETANAASDELVQLRLMIDKFKAMNVFERLGVTPESDDAAIKKSYLKLAKIYHPDTTPVDAPAEMRHINEIIFTMLSDAFKAIETAERRTALIQSGDQSGKGEMVDLQTVMEAEQNFTRAKMLIRNGQGLGEAFKLISEALKQNPKDAEYRIYYFWVLWLTQGAQGGQDLRDKVCEGIKQALEERPGETGYMFLGQIYKSAGDLKGAEEYFRKVLKVAPDNHIAALELRLLEKRAKK
jgi:tetratricopeptide (TPR) repeat protein